MELHSFLQLYASVRYQRAKIIVSGLLSVEKSGFYFLVLAIKLFTLQTIEP